MKPVRRRRSTQERSRAVFDALRTLLLEHPWAEVSLEAVAQGAGTSRQTLYNTFGSRYGLAQGYTLWLADAICDVVTDTIAEHGTDAASGLEAALHQFLDLAAGDPLIDRVRTGEAHKDLLRLVTTDSGPLLTRVAERIEAVVRTAWGLEPDRARSLARTFTRLALSYVTMPPEYDESPAALASGLAQILAPR